MALFCIVLVPYAEEIHFSITDTTVLSALTATCGSAKHATPRIVPFVPDDQKHPPQHFLLNRRKAPLTQLVKKNICCFTISVNITEKFGKKENLKNTFHGRN